MAEQEEIKTLEQPEAMELFSKGKAAWNAWVKKNPVYNVCFGGVSFAKHRGYESAPINFEGFIFPNGKVDFSFAHFGDGSVFFSRTNFGDGIVSFHGTDFCNGYIDFSDACFGKGAVYFDGAKFKNSDVDFNDTEFGKGDIFFRAASFGDGNVDFTNAKFDGDVFFLDIEFGNGDVDFSETIFGKGNVLFKRCNFNNGLITFDKTVFTSGCVDFSNSRFNHSALYFWPCSLNRHVPLFRKTNFSNMIIDGYLSFGEFQTDSVIDLTNTKIGQTVQLDKTRVGYQKTKDFSGVWPFHYKKALKENDSRCFRLLKKYAEEAKDHERKLDFFANEMRADYGYGLTGAKLYLYLLYDKISDYGRSFIRPGIGLFLSTLIFSFIYLGVSLTQSSHKTPAFFTTDTLDAAQYLWGHAFVLSGAHTLPFSFGSRAASTEAMKYLFDGVGPINTILMHGFTIIQGIISTIFLFLIGLAIRNFFRS